MVSSWATDLGVQVASALIVALVVSFSAYLTPWGKRQMRKLGSTLGRGWNVLRSLRVTTQRRLDSEIAEAVRLATAAANSDPADETHGKRHQDYDGWVLGPASEARFWELRNQTGETVTVEGIVPSGPYWPFEWEEPSFPVRLAPGGSVSIRARKLRSGNHLLPWMNDAMANVVYEDEHGDEREALIWILD